LSDKEAFPAGTVLQGKWNGRSYRLERMLGLGANGQVYLATVKGRPPCAVKIGFEAAALQGEANLLASLDDHEKERKPFLLDVDDAVLGGKEVPFYAMRYVPGQPVQTYLRKNGAHWLGVIGYRLLDRLASLHEAGWVFGDMKNDNVLVGDYGRVELIDYGGVSATGRSVRQFTEIYDRGYWSAGSRTADPAYDWFGVAILWLHVLDGKRLMHLTRTLLPQNRHPRELMRLVRSHPKLSRMAPWMERAFAGQFESTREACRYWRETFRGVAKPANPRSNSDRVPGWMAGLFVGSLAVCASLAAFWLFQS
jgi:serine/threonine protein kinase